MDLFKKKPSIVMVREKRKREKIGKEKKLTSIPSRGRRRGHRDGRRRLDRRGQAFHGGHGVPRERIEAQEARGLRAQERGQRARVPPAAEGGVRRGHGFVR